MLKDSIIPLVVSIKKLICKSLKKNFYRLIFLFFISQWFHLIHYHGVKSKSKFVTHWSNQHFESIHL